MSHHPRFPELRFPLDVMSRRFWLPNCPGGQPGQPPTPRQLEKKHQVGHVFSWNDENHMIFCIIFIKLEKQTLHIWQPYFTNKSYPTWHLLTPHFTDVTTELVLISWRSKAGDGPVTAWEGNCPRIKIEKMWKSYGFPFGKRVLYFYGRGQWDWFKIIWYDYQWIS